MGRARSGGRGRRARAGGLSHALTMPLEIQPLFAADEPAWDAFVERHPQGCHCHLSGWRRVVARGYGHAAHYLVARDEGAELRGVLPLVFLGGPLFGRTLVSMPFLDDGGICASDEPALRALGAEALALARRLGAGVVDLRHRQPVGLDWPSFGDKLTLRLGLEGGSERLWSRLDGKVRNQVRKAQRAGLEVRFGGVEALGEFYDVFAVNMRDLGSPVHGRDFFAALLGEFPDSARLAVVRLGGRAIGGAVRLSFKDTVQVPWASSLREFLGLCPNNLLYWEIMKQAADAGQAWLDFGRSSPDSGTYRFKKQWGALEQPLHWQYRPLREGRQPVPDASRGGLSLAVRLWQRLPVGLTRLLGPPIRKHISN